MSLRISALSNIPATTDELGKITPKITTVFGSHVFNLKTAREYLSDDAYKSIVASIKSGQKIDRNVASNIANGMRAWAESKGVTHFTHWFQPLTAECGRAPFVRDIG